MLKFTLLLFTSIILFSSNSYSQSCLFHVDPPLAEICPGDTVCISASGNLAGSTVIDQFDFNTSTLPTGWNVSGGASFGTPCLASLSGTDYYWSSTSGTMTPMVSTGLVDVSLGAVLQFDLVYALQAGSSPCEGPDAWDEGVGVHYSIDGGSTWVEIAYFNPNGTMQAVPGPSISGPTAFTSWGTYCVQVPPGAQTPSTMFRWIQINSSGTDFDNWGLDNVAVTSSLTGTSVNWSNGSVNTPTICVPVSSDTTFTAYLLNSLGDTLYQDQAVITLLSTSQLIDTVSVCPNTNYVFADNTVAQNITSTITHTSNLQGVNGCDSTVITTVIPMSTSQLIDTVAVCLNSNYIFADGTVAQNITSTITHTSIFQDINGCDSTITTTLIPTTNFASVTQTDTTLVAINSGAGISYSWIDCGNNFQVLPGETNQTFVPTQAGTYAVVVTENGCADTSSCFTVTLSLNELNMSEVLIYPNPTTKDFTIDLGKSYSDVTVNIVDGFGRSVYKESFDLIKNIHSQIDGNAGFYFVELLVSDRRLVFPLSKE